MVVLSVREDGVVPPVSTGTGGDERPYAVFPDWYQVEAATGSLAGASSLLATD
jgi:hypothetical protein